MTRQTPSGPDYAVIVVEHRDGIELRIDELLIAARAATFEEAHRKLLEHKSEVMEWVATLDLLDQLPVPRIPPIFSDIPQGPPPGTRLRSRHARL